LDYTIEVPPELQPQKIAPMILQPLIENAITHGISPKVEPSTVSLRMMSLSDGIQVSIEDTGVGIINKSAVLATGLGLTNTNLRLNTMYQSELIITDNHPTGTIVSFRI
jgi:sensor histidine kinase YesM